MKVVCLLAVMSMLAGVAPAQEVLWQFAPPLGYVDASPGVGDLDRDGNIELVVGTTMGTLVVLDHAGKESWRYETGAAVCIAPTIADINGDGLPEILALNVRGRVVCLNAQAGELIWDTLLPSSPEWGATSLAVGDVDGDGAQEIVTGTRDGFVVCLRGSGEIAWVHQDTLGKVCAPAIADLEGDGRREIVVGTEKASLLCLDADGKERWRVDQGGLGASPLVCTLPGSPQPVIITGLGPALTAVDATGKVLWSHPMPRELDGALSIADADGDGVPEIYAADLAGTLVCVSPKGELRWRADVEQRVRRSPSVGDVDGDGAMEILVGGYSNAVHVFDAKGTLKARVPLKGASNSTATLATLGDAGLCVVVPVAGNPMQVLHWKAATRDAKVAWAQYRYDSCRAGALLPQGTAPDTTLNADFGRLYVGPNRVNAIVRNPERRQLTLRTGRHVERSPHLARIRVIRRDHRARLPLHATCD